MDRNTVSEGLLVRYDVRNGRYVSNRDQITGIEHAMGTYTPRILRGSEFYIGDSPQPRPVMAVDGAVRGTRAIKRRNRLARHNNSDVYILLNDLSQDVSDDSEELLPRDQTEWNKSTAFKSISVYLYTMSAFGLCRAFGSSASCKFFMKLYCVFIPLILWVNLLRMLCCFRPGEDKHPGFVLKMCIIAWFAGATVLASVNIFAWGQSALPAVFEKLAKDEYKQTVRSRQRLCVMTAVLTALACGLSLSIIAFYAYATFGPENMFTIEHIALSFCPSGIPTSIVVLKVIFTISFVWTSLVWTFIPLNYLLIVFLLHEKFIDFDGDFRNALAPDKTVHRHFEEYRQRHLAICDMVEQVDRVITFGLSIMFFIALLASFALLTDLCLNVTTSIPVMRIPSGVLFLMSIIVLGVLCLTGVIANNSLNLFLHQMIDVPRGLTLLKMFTITKTTVTIVLSAYIVYITVLLHMVPGSDVESSSRNATFAESGS